jgi:hypothetical protein
MTDDAAAASAQEFEMVEIDLGDGRTVQVRPGDEDAYRAAVGVPKGGAKTGDDAANKKRSTR